LHAERRPDRPAPRRDPPGHRLPRPGPGAGGLDRRALRPRGRVRLHLGDVRPHLPVSARPQDPLADRTGRRQRHRRAVRAPEAGVRLVRHQHRRFRLDLRELRHARDPDLLDLLLGDRVHPRRRSRPGGGDAPGPPSPEGASLMSAVARGRPHAGRRGGRRILPAAALAALAAMLPPEARAQIPRSPGLALDLGFPAPGTEPLGRQPLLSARRFIVIRLAENHLYLIEDGRAIWDAPVATGTGFRLQGGNREWHFVTPRGVFRIQRKELDPVWIKPEWAFVEAGL